MRTILAGTLAGVAIAVVAVASPANAQPYGYGMMGPGYGSGYMMGPGMMGGYGPGYMRGPGYGHGWMMGPGMMGYGGYGPGWMHGYRGGYGPGMMGGYGPGYGNQGNLNLSTNDVKTYLERTMRNPNLKVGEVKEKDKDTITADIVTKDKDVLVQRVQINRHNGFFQPEQ
jgi:hypothetical protein